MKRIAFCISGEPRIFNEKCAESFFGFRETLENQEWIDVCHTYGHTWDHLSDEIDPIYKNKLNGFVTTPFDEIEEWVRQDLNRLHNPLQKNIISYNNIENLIEYTCKFWAQHYGFIRSIDTIPYGLHNYDFTIRWRWDNITNVDHQKVCDDILEAIEYQKNKFEKYYVLFSRHSNIKIRQDSDVVSFQDHYFIMSKLFTENFCERFQRGGDKDYFVFFQNLLGMYKKEEPLPRDHFLWHRVLSQDAHPETIFATSLNNYIQMDRPKKWNTEIVKEERERNVLEQHRNDTNG